MCTILKTVDPIYCLTFNFIFLDTGAISSSSQDGYSLYNENDHKSNMECTGTSDSICYFISKIDSSSRPLIYRNVFSNLNSGSNNHISYPTTIHLSSINTIVDEELIVAGFDKSSSPHAHIFFRINMTAATQSWAKTVTPLGK